MTVDAVGEEVDLEAGFEGFPGFEAAEEAASNSVSGVVVGARTWVGDGDSQEEEEEVDLVHHLCMRRRISCGSRESLFLENVQEVSTSCTSTLPPTMPTRRPLAAC